MHRLHRSTWPVAALIACAVALVAAGVAQAAVRPPGPYLTFAPSTDGAYDFGLVEVSQTASQLFTLTNSGSRSTSALNVTFSGSLAFALSDDMCTSRALSAGKSCTFKISYSPSVPMTDTGKVTATGHKPNVAAALDLSGTGVLPPPPRHVYWADRPLGTIGRADVDGTNVDPSFTTGLLSPFFVAVDTGHIYWSDYDLGAIGRADLDGTNVDPSFITGIFQPVGVAVDSGHVYWAVFGAIGRADLDGSNLDPSFITGPDLPVGLAVDSGHLYWADFDAIGRADLDGTNVEPNFIPIGLSYLQGLAVDSGHIYWADDLPVGAIGRADLDGTNVDRNFMTGPDLPVGLAVDSGHIYWADHFPSAIGRADLDGTNMDRNFITGLSYPYGVAVESG